MNFRLVAAVAAVALDRLLGEPRRFHPLVASGALADRLQLLNPPLTQATPPPGCPASSLDAAVLPFVLVALGCAARVARCRRRSMSACSIWHRAQPAEHAGGVVRWPPAIWRRRAHGRLDGEPRHHPTGRQRRGQGGHRIGAENGNDAVGALFWFFLLAGRARCCSGWPIRWTRCGATARRAWLFRRWAAARVDDLLNFVPARLTR